MAGAIDAMLFGVTAFGPFVTRSNPVRPRACVSLRHLRSDQSVGFHATGTSR